jgi:hypothetical protein
MARIPLKEDWINENFNEKNLEEYKYVINITLKTLFLSPLLEDF